MQPILEIKNIHKKYKEKIVHEDISFNIYPNEILTLMGGSGSGKSVLLRSIIGLDKPDQGQIFFENKDLTLLTETQWVSIRKKIAYVFQYGALFDSYTVFENLAYPLREHTNDSDKVITEKVKNSLDTVGLVNCEQLLPSDLSGGMQRRVGVARSIILNPGVILYDEPTTGLDPYNTKQILKIILNLKKLGATTVLVTHDMSSIFEISDRVAFLRQGKIHAIGTKQEIKNSTDPVLQGFMNGDRI